MKSGRVVRSFDHHTKCVSSVAFHPSGGIIAIGSDDKTASLCDVENGNVMSTIRIHTNAVRSVSFSPNGDLIATGSADNTVAIHDISKYHCAWLFVLLYLVFVTTQS